MRVLNLLGSVALGLLVWGLAWAQDMREAGKQTFSLGIGSAPGDTAVQDTLTLYVLAQAAVGHGPTGRIHLTIPKGLGLVSGDTTYEELVTKMPPARQFRLKPDRSGSFEVRGTLEIDTAPGESDFLEVSLPITVDGRTLRPGVAVTRRNECTRGGQRFRLAGFWLVPLEDGDVVDNLKLQREGTRPRAISTLAASCASCPAGAQDTIMFVVVVSKQGKVIQAEAQSKSDGTSPSQEGVAAARVALSTWRFDPAKLQGQPVNDWCMVAVPLRSR